MRKARGFSLFLSTFPRKTHLSQKRSRVSLPASPTGSPPRPGHREKFHIAAEKVRRNAHAFTFFYFCLLSMREKHAIFASKTCFINSAWQNLGASSPFSFARRSAPTHSIPAYDASFRHPFAQCRLSGARPKHPGRHPGPASHFPAGTTSRHGATVTHRQPLRAEQRPAHRHLRRIGRHPPLRRLPAAQLERRHRTL